MIECVPQSVIDLPDQRVIERLGADWLNVRFDEDFVRMLPSFHGGTPLKPYFKSARGKTYRIAFFLNLLDEQSELTPPLLQSKDFFNDATDRRITDRGIEYIIDCDSNGFFNGQRIVPFAALYTPDDQTGFPIHPDDPQHHLTLTPLDSVSCNAVCFDKSTMPHSVVVFDAARSEGEQERFDDGVDHDEIRYDDFIDFVAGSFADFSRLLTEKPPREQDDITT